LTGDELFVLTVVSFLDDTAHAARSVRQFQVEWMGRQLARGNSRADANLLAARASML
jgi:hypothetical protein